MQINNNVSPAGIGGPIRTEVERSEKKSGTSVVGEATEAKLSETAKLAASGGAPFDSEKVAAIRKSIQDGTFTVNASAVADAMIGSLFGGPRR